MKLLLLACLAALALAGEKEELSVSSETSESLSGSEESIAHIKQKLQKAKHEERQQRQDARQDKTPFAAPRAVLAPLAAPMPYPVLLPAAPPAAPPALVPALLPVLQPEVMESLDAQEPAPAQSRLMPFLAPPTPLAAFGAQDPNQPAVALLVQPAARRAPQDPRQAPPQGPPQVTAVLAAQPQLLALELQAVHDPRQQQQPGSQRHTPAQLLQLYRALQPAPTLHAPETRAQPQEYDHIVV